MKVCPFLLFTFMLGIEIENLAPKYLLVQLKETAWTNEMPEKSLETTKFKKPNLKGGWSKFRYTC